MSTERARALRKNPTEAERTLWKHLRMRQLHGHKFRRQQPLGSYIVDFVCVEKRLIVELDGGQHARQAASDAERTAWLRAQGFRVRRFWNHDVMRDIQAVEEAIRQALLRG
jgi:very-short-patch-repair endonuclease